MKVLILAAGYATRLYPLTLKQAKPLLKVAGKPMIEWIVDQLMPIPFLEEIFIVTNNQFVSNFEMWSAGYRHRENRIPITIINDGSNSDADKRGAIGDIHFVLEKQNAYHDEMMVVAGDNLFNHGLQEFAEFAHEHPATLGVYDVKDLEAAKRYNKLTTNTAGILTDFEEKPASPTSTICGIALYYYQPDVLRLIDQYVGDGNNPDQPGRFIQWLHKRVDVFTFPISGLWYDIGDHETLKKADEIFRQG
jgi:glucose-1-phosphate thymidylyltransferase